MKSAASINLSIASILLALSVAGCSSSSDDDDDDSVSSTIYSTTSNRGDYSEWTLSGNTLNASWDVINNSGLVDFTYTIAATCGAADSAGIHSCSIDTASCTDGASTCTDTPSGSFDMMDVPGVALFVLTDDGGSNKQLHVGFVKNASACSDDVSGDYSFIRTGLGLDENFGMYRSDSNFVNILHSDFGFDTADNNVTQSVAYRTGTESETLTDNGCTSGVRERNVGGETIRSMMTASGLFVLDFPAGQGGLISFKTSNAATLSDFAGNNFGGISFPDNGPPETFSATLGTLASDRVGITVNFDGGTSQTLDLMDLGTTDTATNPSFPDFTASPTGYNSSVLSGSYTSPDDIPGLFKIDELSSGDSGRVIMLAMKYNGKVIAVGMVYNLRDTSDIDPSAGDGVTTFPADGLYNTGNFILFEQ